MRSSALNQPMPSLRSLVSVAAIRDALRDACYTEATCRRVLGIADVGMLWYSLPQLQASRGPTGGMVETLMKMFLLNTPIRRDVATRHWSRGLEQHLLEARLIRSSQDLISPLVSIFPCKGLFVVTDLTQARCADDQVFWLSPDSYWLASTITQLQGVGGRGLDVGTGSGVHALLLAKRNFTVAAVEINPRANRFAQFNSVLNEVNNVSWHTGNLYSGLPPNECFDLIVAHPPYSPDDESIPGQNYWSGGPLGDAIIDRILAGLFEFLTDSGLAIICALITYRSGETLKSRLQGWLGGYMKYFDIIVERKHSDYGTMLQNRTDEEGRRRYAHWLAMKIEGTDTAKLFIRKNLSAGGTLTVKTIHN